MARDALTARKRKSSKPNVIGEKRSKAIIRDIDLHQKALEIDMAEDGDNEALTSVFINKDEHIKSKIEKVLHDSLEDDFSDTSEDLILDDNTDDNCNNLLNHLNEEEERAYNAFLKTSHELTDNGSRNEFNLHYTHEKQNINEYIQDLKDQELPPLVVETYRNVGLIMRRYRSGAIPKAFKIVPILERWLEIFSLMEPDKWTASAVFQATKYFISSAKPYACEKFINLLLLPRVRDDIAEYKKLNYHIQNALRISTRKPAAFFKGFLIPLCHEGNCTLREAVIIGGILRQCKIPVLHVSVAILKIASMQYSGANSLFLQIFLKKNYALPYKVLDAMVDHFLKFLYEEKTLTVLWYQSLLTFVQGYARFLADEQKELLLDLCHTKKHSQITPEIIKAIHLSNNQCE